MIRGLKSYPAYKDSGLPSIGKIPYDWNVRRLKHAFQKIVGGSTPSSTEPTFWDGGIVWITPMDVSRAKLLTKSIRTISREGLSACSSELVPPGSVIVTSRAPVGNVALAGVELCTNQGCKALVPNLAIIEPSFAFAVINLLQSEFQSIATGTTFAEISTAKIATVPMPLPPLSEQKSIIHFLGYIDRRIRRYVRAKQKLIALLNEQKQAIVHRAVTRGLDPNVRLRPSGVEWLGNVPEHWRVARAKQIFKEVDRRSTTGEEVLLSLRMYKGLVPHNEVSAIPIPPRALVGFKKVLPGQLVMNRMRAAIGMFGVAPQPGLVSPDYAVFKPSGEVDTDYFLNLLKTPLARTVLRLESKGLGTGSSGFMRLYGDRFGAIKLPFPPLNEQKMIVQRIGGETVETERALDRTSREIAALQEYRTRLSSDVVTGKLDVRAAAVLLPEEFAEAETLDEIEPLDEHENAELEAAAEEADA